MDMESLALAQQRTEDRSIRNEGRIKKLEAEHEVLHELATSVAVMAERMEVMNKSVLSLDNKVSAMEAEPGKRWKFVVEKAIYILVAAFGGYIMARIGLG